MKRVRQIERRGEARFPQSFGLRVRALPTLGSIENPENFSIPARVQNISDAGMCLVTSDPVERFSVLRCEVPVGETDQPVVTLMQVRWTQQRGSGADSFLSGLKALL